MLVTEVSWVYKRKGTYSSVSRRETTTEERRKVKRRLYRVRVTTWHTFWQPVTVYIVQHTPIRTGKMKRKEKEREKRKLRERCRNRKTQNVAMTRKNRERKGFRKNISRHTVPFRLIRQSRVTGPSGPAVILVHVTGHIDFGRMGKMVQKKSFNYLRYISCYDFYFHFYFSHCTYF